MQFDYKLTGSGWATAMIANGDQEIEMTVSYLHDSLEQLAQSVLALHAGQPEATTVFMDEPGEHHVIFSLVSKSAVNVTVKWFNDWQSWGLPHQPPETWLEFSTTLSELHLQVLAAFDALLAEHGVSGYAASWGEHEFPVFLHERLRRWA
jgi:hypothetical protein